MANPRYRYNAPCVNTVASVSRFNSIALSYNGAPGGVASANWTVFLPPIPFQPPGFDSSTQFQWNQNGCCSPSEIDVGAYSGSSPNTVVLTITILFSYLTYPSGPLTPTLMVTFIMSVQQTAGVYSDSAMMANIPMSGFLLIGTHVFSGSTGTFTVTLN